MRAHSGAKHHSYELLTGDVSEVLRTLPAASVDCVVTSPLYWRMRDYATGRWSGGRADCPHSAGAAAHTAPRACIRCGASWTDAQYGLEPTPTANVEHLRQVQGERYLFDLDPIRQPYTGDRSLSRRAHRGGNKPHTARGAWPVLTPGQQDNARVLGRNPGDVWVIPVTPWRHQAHPAVSPLEIPLRCIAAGCPPRGTVLDCFSGTGTTGVAALRLGRSYTGIDLSPAFHAIARHRLSQITGPQASSGTEADEHGEAA